MEKQGEYIVKQEEVHEALDMLGKGYEAAYEIHKGESVIRDEEGGQQEYDTGAWIKIAALFRNKHLKRLKGSRLGVWLCVVLHINQKNNSHPSIETICEETGYSNREVIDCIRELEKSGYLTVIRGQERYNIYHVNIGAAYGAGNNPTCELSSQVNFDAKTSEVSSKKTRQSSLKEEPIKKNKKEDAATPLSSDTFLEFEKLKAQHQEKGWAGREQFRDDHLLYADWWYSLSGQPAKGNKPQMRSCQKAFSDWQNQGLDISSLQQSYDARLTWKKFIVDPNELTKDAAAIQAMPKAITTSGPAINEKAVEATKELLKQKEGNYVPMPEHLRRQTKAALTKISDIAGNMFPERQTE